MIHNNISDICAYKSSTFLSQNCTNFGILAASPKDPESVSKNYTSLFSRDVGVCTYGVLNSSKDALIQSGKQSLITLAEAQSPLGQFPFYYIPESKTIRWWSPGAPDSTLWWGIAFLEYKKQMKDSNFYKKYSERIEKAFTWLTFQDTNQDCLIEQGEASDWADEMPRMGTVLYTNTLWYWFVSLRIEVEGRKDLKPLQQKIYEAFNTLLWIHKLEDNTINYIPNNDYIQTNVYAKGFIELTNSQAVYLPYYLSFMSHKSFEMRCDVYANILACLVGLANEEKKQKIVDFIYRSGANQPYPVKALYPPIYPGERDWKDYMAKGRQDYPWQYHNGGIWPYIGGFWVSLLAAIDKKKANEQLQKLAEANSLNDWEFNEYLHGQHGTPMGIPRQSWNMAMYLHAYHSVK